MLKVYVKHVYSRVLIPASSSWNETTDGLPAGVSLVLENGQIQLFFYLKKSHLTLVLIK